ISPAVQDTPSRVNLSCTASSHSRSQTRRRCIAVRSSKSISMSPGKHSASGAFVDYHDKTKSLAVLRGPVRPSTAQGKPNSARESKRSEYSDPNREAFVEQAFGER